MEKTLAFALVLSMLFGCACGNQGTAPSSDNVESSTGTFSQPAEENAVKEELILIGEGFMRSSGERLEVDLDIGSITDEYLTLQDGRKVCQYFLDYDSAFLAFYDPAAKTIEPFFDLRSEFETWTQVKVEQGPAGSLLILCGNRLCRYDLATKRLQSDHLQVRYPEEWSDGALIAVQYDEVRERYVVAFTQWEPLYLEQNHELILAVFDKEGSEIDRHHTGAPVLRDSFVVWSVPFIRIEGDQVFFQTFTPEFAKQYPELEQMTGGLGENTEGKKQYAKLAQESYREYSYHLETGELDIVKSSDPFQNINWKLVRYLD